MVLCSPSLEFRLVQARRLSGERGGETRGFIQIFAFSKTHKTNVNHSTQTHSFPPQFIPDDFSQLLRESATRYLNLHNSTTALILNRILHSILYSQLDFTLIPVALNYECSLTTHLKEFERHFISRCSPWKKKKKGHNCLS